MPSEYMTSWPAMPNYPAQLANIHADLVVRGIPCHTAQDSVIVPMADGRTITITRDDEYRACLSWRCGLADMTMRCQDVAAVDEVVWLYSCSLNDNGGK